MQCRSAPEMHATTFRAATENVDTRYWRIVGTSSAQPTERAARVRSGPGQRRAVAPRTGPAERARKAGSQGGTDERVSRVDQQRCAELLGRS